MEVIDFANKILLGNCLNVMKDLPSESIDEMVTDPPYGYNFMGNSWDIDVPSVEIWQECLRIMKPGAFGFVFSAPRQDVLAKMIVKLGEAGFVTGFSSIYWVYNTGFPKSLNIGKAIDKKLGRQREVVSREAITFGIGGASNRLGGEKIVDLPASDEAKAMHGSYAGYNPKPAVEIIIVVMKPLSEKSYTEQAMKNGLGVTWLDNCKIPYDKSKKRDKENKDRRMNCDSFGWKKPEEKPEKNEDPRFPANLICSNNSMGDDSKYFDLDKWWDDLLNKWWEEGIKKLPENLKKTFPVLVVPKPSSSEKNEDLHNIEETKRKVRWKQSVEDNWADIEMTSKNIHPTCKPLKICSYLIMLGSKRGDIVLDPFVGSGTTCLAAKMNNRKFVGIEMNEKYFKIAEERIKKQCVYLR